MQGNVHVGIQLLLTTGDRRTQTHDAQRKTVSPSSRGNHPGDGWRQCEHVTSRGDIMSTRRMSIAARRLAFVSYMASCKQVRNRPIQPESNELPALQHGSDRTARKDEPRLGDVRICSPVTPCSPAPRGQSRSRSGQRTPARQPPHEHPMTREARFFRPRHRRLDLTPSCQRGV